MVTHFHWKRWSLKHACHGNRLRYFLVIYNIKTVENIFSCGDTGSGQFSKMGEVFSLTDV